MEAMGRTSQFDNVKMLGDGSVAAVVASGSALVRILSPSQALTSKIPLHQHGYLPRQSRWGSSTTLTQRIRVGCLLYGTES